MNSESESPIPIPPDSRFWREAPAGKRRGGDPRFPIRSELGSGNPRFPDSAGNGNRGPAARSRPGAGRLGVSNGFCLPEVILSKLEGFKVPRRRLRLSNEPHLSAFKLPTRTVTRKNVFTLRLTRRHNLNGSATRRTRPSAASDSMHRPEVPAGGPRWPEHGPSMVRAWSEHGPSTGMVRARSEPRAGPSPVRTALQPVTVSESSSYS